MSRRTADNEVLQLSQATQNAIVYVGNHDIRGAAYTDLAEIGIATPRQLGVDLSERAEIDIVSPVRAYPVTFSKGGFAEHWAIDRHGTSVTAFQATNVGLGRAAVGALSGWSDSHDLSLVKWLSMTSSRGSRGPINTIQMLDRMLQGESHRVIIGMGVRSINHTRLNKLVKDGIVVVEDDTYFAIQEPRYKGSKPFDELKPATQKVYKILQIAKDSDPNPVRKWSMVELEDMAAEIGLVGEEDKKDFHKTLAKAVATPRAFPGAVEKVDIGQRRYKIAPQFIQVAADLVERVLQLDRSKSMRQAFATEAEDLLYDTPRLQRVILRGLRDSPYIKSKTAGHNMINENNLAARAQTK